MGKKSKAGRIQRALSGAIVTTVAVIASYAYVSDGDGAIGENFPDLTISHPATDVVDSSLDSYRNMLSGLEIKGRAPATGYAREQFGQAWSDDVTVEFGHNGCDTRNDILRRDLTDTQIKEGTHDCVVLTGTLEDPFSGDTIDFVRGPRSADVQIDHIVPLHDAWVKGAQQWDEETRRNFANDPINLQAVAGTLNQQKGAGDVATWLPPNRAFRCDYAKAIITVKDKYGVWVTKAESDALGRQLDTCLG
ncbi:hypothetical protein CDES_06140 [Corynebacterium deserti GIMN1.010]|uniref:GmrSD restriction endonucleases C-terminal domain-containing protein n=1 Tax=Corynebacterium deserti GIMN1.010 TaxID=931089 RepID=A0A0M5ILI9_9CORY|nr:HNH endonuclease family protein [Corynebacterium deserti]ALC05656.1 hypothetical protein CDES_06140 [Corynebacterium deserti GIMN1.010]